MAVGQTQVGVAVHLLDPALNLGFYLIMNLLNFRSLRRVLPK
jgi:hypothetical protein